jgi:D-alanine-D-alanine ligase-like ATP-grasp enzyme
VRELLVNQSRRRAAAPGGESEIPLDAETERCVMQAGYSLSDTPEANVAIVVRKAANLHTGGTIHDVTDKLHPKIVEVSKRAAEVLDIPVVGLDLMVPSVIGSEYWLIEANERPGLANHEPQPTAERFVDLLFPQTVS